MRILSMPFANVAHRPKSAMRRMHAWILASPDKATTWLMMLALVGMTGMITALALRLVQQLWPRRSGETQ